MRKSAVTFHKFFVTYRKCGVINVAYVQKLVIDYIEHFYWP